MRNILRITSLLFFILLIGKSFCLAQDLYPEGESITLYVGEVRTFSVDSPTRVAISNPEVADVTSISKDEMLIVAKGAGTTNLIWWDSFGQHALQLQVFPEDMSEIKQRIDELLKALNLPDVYTRSADSEGKVLLLGEVKSAAELEQIDTALGELKEKTTNLIRIEEEKASVEIDLQVLELNRDGTKTLGIGWPTTLSLTESSGPTTAAVTGWSALFHVSDWTRSAFNTTVNLLVQEGKARVLSRPRLVCQSGKEAEFLVGGEKPILTTQAISGGGSSTEVEYKEYGIKLNIRPEVVSGNRIQVSLNIEVSEVGTAEILGSASSPTARAYPLTKRSTSTQLLLDNAQTLAMSGLIKQKTEEELKKFPWLADIPILGLFFRGKDIKIGGGRGELGDTELVITLTPTILAGIETPVSEMRSSELSGGQKPYLGISRSAIDSYTQRVIKRIRDNFVYPAEAYRNKLEGLVRLSLRLSSAGELLEIKIRQSSGWRILDENAVRIIKRVSPFPSFPADIGEKELWINIPIAYNIK